MEEEFNINGEFFSLKWDPQSQILFIDFWGEQNKKTAKEFENAEAIFFNKFTVKSLKIMVDATKVTKVDHEARRTFSEAVKKYPISAKTAVCYKNILFKIAAGFITMVSMGRLKVNFFEDKEKALEWLKKD